MLRRVTCLLRTLSVQVACEAPFRSHAMHSTTRHVTLLPPPPMGRLRSLFMVVDDFQADAGQTFTSASNPQRRSETRGRALDSNALPSESLFNQTSPTSPPPPLYTCTTHRKVYTKDDRIACLQDQVINLAPRFQTVSHRQRRRPG